MSEMISKRTLATLLSAITSSIVEAQQQMEQTQVTGFRKYFEEGESERGLVPVTMKLALPSMRPDAAPGERDTYHAPYISLLPHSGLRIEKTEVEFDVSLNGVAITGVGADRENPEEKAIEFTRVEEQPDLQIDLNGNWGRGKGLSARFKFVVSSVDLPEGTMRMIDELNKTSQGFEIPRQAEQ